MSYSGTKTIKPDDEETLHSRENPYLLDLPSMELYYDEEPRGQVPWDKKEVAKPVALQMRLDGYSYAQIGDAIGKHKDTVKEWVKGTLRERAEAREELGDLIIQYAVDGIHRVKQNVLTLIDQIDRMIKRKQDNGEDIPASLIREKRQALSDLLRVNKEFRQLLGLDAPEQVQHQHEGGVEFDLNITPPDQQDYDEPDEEPLDADFEPADEGDPDPLPEGEDMDEALQEIEAMTEEIDQAAEKVEIPIDD